MSFENLIIGTVYANCILPDLSLEEVFSHCRLTKKAREFAIGEIFKRGSLAWHYQSGLFHFNIQQGQVLPSAKLIVQLFKKIQHTHNVKVLADNLDEKLEKSSSSDEMILNCLAQNINNGIRLFNPEKRYALPLCSQTPMEHFITYYTSIINVEIRYKDCSKLDPLEKCYRAILFAQKFFLSSGSLDDNEQTGFSNILKVLTNTENIPDKLFLNALLGSLITCLLSVDEKLLKNDLYIPHLVNMIFITLADFAQYLPEPHLLGLIHLSLNKDVQNKNIICKFAVYLTEENQHRFMEILIERVQKDSSNHLVLNLIGELASWLTDTQKATVIDYLSKLKGLYVFSVSAHQALGKVAARSKSRVEIFDGFIEEWKNSDSTPLRNNLLSIIGEMAIVISPEKCLDAIKIIHQNVNDKDDVFLYGLNKLTERFTEKFKKNDTRELLDDAFQFFLTEIQEDQRGRLLRANFEAFHHLLPLLSDLQKKSLLPVILSLFSRPNDTYPQMLTLHIVRNLPESERIPELMAAIAVSGISPAELALKYRGLSVPEIQEFQILPKSKRFYSLSRHFPGKMPEWFTVLENASLETARLMTAKLLEIHPEMPANSSEASIISSKGMTNEQYAGILAASMKCLQNDVNEIQNAGILVMEQLVRDGCNLSLYKDLLLTPLLGCIIETFPKFTMVRESVVGLIGHMVPGLASDELEVVVNALKCLKHNYIHSSQEIITTIKAIITAKKDLIDDLLPLLFITIKKDTNTLSSPGRWLVGSQLLSFLNEKQTNLLIEELHSWVQEGYTQYHLRVDPILFDLYSKGSANLKVYIKVRFGKERQLLAKLSQGN